MIRSQAQPQRPIQPNAPKPLTPEQVEAATRDNPALLLAAQADLTWVPKVNAVLGSSSLELAFRFHKVRPFLSGSWLAGTSDGGPMRWVSVGIGADRTFWWSANLHINIGLQAEAATVRMQDVAFAGEAGRDTWMAMATMRFRTEWALGRSTWLGVSIDPGMLLRSAVFDSPSATQSLQGFYLGAGVSLQWERRMKEFAITPVAGL